MKRLSVTMDKREVLLSSIYYPIQLLLLPSAITVLNVLGGNPLSRSLLNFIFFCINFVCICLFCFEFLKKNGKNALSEPFRCLRYAAAGLIINWGLGHAVQLLIAAISPDFFNVNDASINTMVQENYGLMALGTVFLVPIVEETLYRGLMFGQLYNRNPFAAYAVSVTVFAAVHVINYIGMYKPLQLVLCFLQYLPAGIALAWAYAKSDTIWAPILMHIAVNQIGIASMR